MKKLISGLLCGILVVAGVTVFAADAIKIIVNDVDISENMEVKPQIVDGLVVAPVENVVGALGAVAEYDEKTKTVTVKDARLGLDDCFPDSEVSIRDMLVSNSNVNIDRITQSDEYETLCALLDMVSPEVGIFMIIDDYKTWVDGGDSLLGGIWEDFYVTDSTDGGTRPDYDGITIGDMFVFDDLEITVGSIENIIFENRFSEHNGATVIRLPLYIKNVKKESHTLNFYNYTVYGPEGVEATDLFAYYDDSVLNSGKVRSGATQTAYIYVVYEGDGDYYIEFAGLFGDNVVEVWVPVNIK